GPSAQRGLLAARRGSRRVRLSPRRHPCPREAALDRPARDQRGTADLRGRRGPRSVSRISWSSLTFPQARQHVCRACGVSWWWSHISEVRGETVDKPRVVLGVSGGIAAYKACELLRRLTESGHDVRVVPTASALNFVGAATWSALSGNPVATEVWDDVHEVPHVRIGQQADLVVVAPATSDML